MPIDYSKYPPNWKSEIVPLVLKRDEYKCKFCGLHQYSIVHRNSKGIAEPLGGTASLDLAGQGLKFPSLQKMSYKEARQVAESFTEHYGKKHIVIVLTIAHLDHDETNHNVETNKLAALCQQCHLRYDAKEKANRRKRKKKQLTLFKN